jgi:RND family efflux transporter MFP subunit
MRRYIGWGLGALVIAAASLGVWGKHRAPADAPTNAAGPVATIRSEMPRVQSVAETLAAVGDISAGQASGLSFPRAGQVTTLGVVVGDRFAKGAVLATLAPDPAVKQAYQAAVDAAGLAQRERDRQKELLASHLATRSQVDVAEKALLDAQGALKALDEQGGGRGASPLVAPFDGVVTTVSVMQGDRVQAGAPVLQVGRVDVLRVLIGIEPSDRVRVHAGTRVTVWPVVGPAAESRPIELVLSDVQDAVDPKTQLVNVVAPLPRAAAAQVAPGMKVRAQLQVGAISAVAVPRNAVLADEKGDYVFQVAAGKARRVAVKKTLDNGTLTAIAGLKDLALPVVTEGNYELEDGMAVKDAAQ